MFTSYIFLPLWVFFPQEACGFFKTFFLKILIYLAALGLGGGTWDLRYIMQDISLLHTGSAVVVCRISCPTACGILVPGPRVEPAPLVLQSKFLTTGPPEKSPHHSFDSGITPFSIFSSIPKCELCNTTHTNMPGACWARIDICQLRAHCLVGKTEKSATNSKIIR